MVIQGHRGGFKPGNCLENFIEAINLGILIIELDVSERCLNKLICSISSQVWLTSDNELIVVHGGYSGEVNFGSY